MTEKVMIIIPYSWIQYYLRTVMYAAIIIAALPLHARSQEPPQSSRAFLSIDEIMAAWDVGYGSIKTMKVEFSEAVTGIARDSNGNDTVLNSKVEMLQDGKKFWINYVSTCQELPRLGSNIECAFNGSTTQFCDRQHSMGHIEKGIDARGYERRNSLQRYMWLSRYYHDPDYPNGETHFGHWVRVYRAESLQNDYVKVFVRPTLEAVAGELCHVVEIARGRNGMRFWVAHAKGMLPMKYEKVVAHKVKVRFEVLKTAKTATDIGEVWYPSVVRAVNENLLRGSRQVSECTVQEFKTHLDIAEDAFRISFPDGVRVYDRALGLR
jgi:hypothetical protein